MIHYGVTRSHSELEQALLTNDYVSAHIALTGRNGVNRITQLVPFNLQAGHAGKTAVWNGRGSVNSFSIGIEINNPGPVLLGEDGLYRDVYKRRWDGDVVPGKHERPGFSWSHWASYTDLEIAAVTALVLELQSHYDLIDVVGHDQIRKDKADPGPAFPMRDVRSFVFPESA